MHRGLWNMDHASFLSEATLIEIGVYSKEKYMRRQERLPFAGAQFRDFNRQL